MARAIRHDGFELPEIDYTGLEAIRYGRRRYRWVRQYNRIAQKAQTSDDGLDELNILSPDTDLEGFNMGIDELGY